MESGQGLGSAIALAHSQTWIGLLVLTGDFTAGVNEVRHDPILKVQEKQYLLALLALIAVSFPKSLRSQSSL